MCDCRVRETWGGGRRFEIEYCDRHEAAPDLYEALKNLVSEIIKMGDSGWYNEEGGFVKIAQAALALVDKETT